MASRLLDVRQRGQKVSVHTPVVKITDANGHDHLDAALERDAGRPRAEIADQVNFVLKQVVDDDKGTGHKEARVAGQIVAGKTGTAGLEDEENKRRRRTATPGSSATRARSRPPCGWATATRPTPSVGLRASQPVNGGSLPARIFGRFMTDAPPRTRNPARSISQRASSASCRRPRRRPRRTTGGTVVGARPRPGRRRDHDDAVRVPGFPTTTDPDRPTTTRRNPFPTLPGQTTTTRDNGPGN